MPAQIILTATCGDLAGQTFVFAAPARCYLGRSRDCSLSLPARDLFASRHHCVVEVEPEQAVIRDLGSRNGTYLNGRCIGGHDEVEPAALDGGWPRKLTAGDEVRVGTSVFRVTLEA